MSVLGKLNLNDFLKGLLITVISAVLITLGEVISSPGFSFSYINWDDVLKVALSSGIAYLIKNLATDEQGKVLGIGK